MIRNTFVLLPSVGPKKEKAIWESGVRTWDDFVSSERVSAMKPAAKENGCAAAVAQEEAAPVAAADPRLQGISDAIRVVPHFPKQGCALHPPSLSLHVLSG